VCVCVWVGVCVCACVCACCACACKPRSLCHLAPYDVSPRRTDAAGNSLPPAAVGSRAQAWTRMRQQA
jgi:hypothetical protein